MKNVYFNFNTFNKSFIKVSDILKEQGVLNNKFFLALYDMRLETIDPYHPDLNNEMKSRIIKECYNNYWYFLREVLSPQQGNFEYGDYILTEYNLKMHFAMANNLNIITNTNSNMSIKCRLLWEFLFGSKRSEILLLDKKHKYSKDLLVDIKLIYNELPDYMKLSSLFMTHNGTILNQRTPKIFSKIQYLITKLVLNLQ